MNYKYCPNCKGLLEVYEGNHFRCSQCGFTIYRNPKPTASAIITDEENRVLLGKRSIVPSKGLWDVPGGFLELGESPEVGLRREIREELGVEIDILELLGFFMDTYSLADENHGDSTLNICYLAKIKSGEPKAESELDEIKWFKVDEIQMDQIAFKNGQDMLKAWIKRLK